MRIECYFILAFLAMLFGCNTSTSEFSMAKPIQEEDATVVKRVGLLPTQENQHPLIVGSVIQEGYQGYLDLFE